MGASVDDIKTALAASTTLELSEDGTKVKRKTPFVSRTCVCHSSPPFPTAHHVVQGFDSIACGLM